MQATGVIELLQNIVFLSGALRSGSTLLKLILDNHSRVSNPGEFDFLFDLIDEDGTLPDINVYKNWLESNRIFLAHQLTVGQEVETLELLRNFVKQLEAKKNTLILNVHRGFHKIPSVFSGARYIHLLRDPRDVGLSSIKMGWAGNAYHGIDQWVETERSWDRLRPQLDEEQFIEVKYEDLVSSSQEVLEKICKFLNLKMEQDMFNFFKTSTYGQINKNSLYRWKLELSAEENSAIEYKLSNLLSQKGYEVQSKTSKKPNALKLAGFTIENKTSKWAFSLNRYGIRLFLMGKIANLLSLNELSKSLNIERNEISKKFLK